MRAFIAIEIPEDVKQKIAKFQSKLEKADIFRGRFVEKENLHLALKFLGEISEADVHKISKVLEEMCKKFKGFTLFLKGVGAFPSEDYVRVCWAGVDTGGLKAKELHLHVDRVLASIGSFKPDARYANHITLARVRSVIDKKKLAALFEDNKEKEFGSFDVKEIKLIKSELTSQGPVYETLAKFDLAGPH